MTRSFYTQSGTRLRATTSVDARNDTVQDWTTPGSLAITSVRLQPLRAEEIRPGFTGEVVTHRLLAASTADILFGDRWQQDGVTWDVDGSPAIQNSPAGTAAHLEVLLRRVSG